MKTKDFLIGGAAFLVGYHLYINNDKSKLGKEIINLRLKITGVTVEHGLITIFINVINPNSANLEIKSFVGNIYSGSVKIADVKMFGDYVVYGNSELEIPLVANPVLTNLMMQLFATYKQRVINIMFDGSVNVNDNLIPLKLNYTK